MKSPADCGITTPDSHINEAPCIYKALQASREVGGVGSGGEIAKARGPRWLLRWIPQTDVEKDLEGVGDKMGGGYDRETLYGML